MLGLRMWKPPSEVFSGSGENNRHNLTPSNLTPLFPFATRLQSCPWMIAPGLLGASPVRLVTDILLSTDCSVCAPDVLDGLLARSGRDGPALAADFFAVVVSAVAKQCTTGISEGGDNAESRLRSQVWRQQTRERS